MEDLENDRLIGPAEAARWCDFVSHARLPDLRGLVDGPDDSELVPFLAEVTRWLASGAPVLFEEFGPPTTPGGAGVEGLVDEAAAAVYTGRVLDGLRAVGCRGAFLWCFSDYASDLSSVPPFDAAPHELSFGLWRADGTAKPAVAEVTSRAGAACVAPGSPGDWLDIDADDVRGGPAPSPPAPLRPLPRLETPGGVIRRRPRRE